MGVEGIGASVVRKEDRRFITGKGRYVDDIKLVGMTHAQFIRSPLRSPKPRNLNDSSPMPRLWNGSGLDRAGAVRGQGR